MQYIALHINGWLNGTVCRFLTKAEKAIWGDFCALGGSGEGRIGYIEEFKHLPYSREKLLEKTHCFSDEDIAAFDSCYKKCLEGVTIADELDKARISLDEYGCIKIENWNVYQHSDYPQGYTESEAKELKRLNKSVKAKAKESIPLDTAINKEYKAKELAKQAFALMAEATKINPDIASKTVSELETNETHNRGGNHSKKSKIMKCKCMDCGANFKTNIEPGEVTNIKNGFVTTLRCKDCWGAKN
jgi:hypothetical protein